MPNITPSEDRTVETVHIPNNPTLTGLARLTRNVAYRTGADDLVMDIIAPLPHRGVRAGQRVDHTGP